MATLLSSVGFLLIYGYLVFSHLPLNSYHSPFFTFGSIMPLITNTIIQTLLLSLYFTLASFFIITGIINFVKGLIIATKLLRSINRGFT